MQQYFVDQFAKVEAEHLKFIQQNQKRLWAMDYTSIRDMLRDSAHMEDEADLLRRVRFFKVPSSHVGGGRYIRQQKHDIIAISDSLGHPDTFLTIKCNPRRPEIICKLKEGQFPQDHPDLAAGEFRMKHKVLMEYVKDEVSIIADPATN